MPGHKCGDVEAAHQSASNLPKLTICPSKIPLLSSRGQIKPYHLGIPGQNRVQRPAPFTIS